MKKTMKRGVSLCMAVALLLTATALAPPASAEDGEKSLEKASITVEEDKRVVDYNGGVWKPDVKVELDGQTLIEFVDYTVTYKDNIDAGTGLIIVTGKDAYTGVQEEKFTILPRKVRASDLEIEKGYTKEYDGTKTAWPEIEAKKSAVFAQDNVTVVCKRAEFDTPYVGRQKSITVYEVAFEGEKKGNYTMENSELALEDNSAQITRVEAKLEKTADLAMGHTIDLKELILNDWQGEATFHLPEGDTLGCTLEGTKLTAGQELGSLEIQVDMAAYDVNQDGEEEYTSGIGFIDLTIVEKEDPPDPVITVPSEEDDPTDPSQEKPTDPSITQVSETSVTYGKTLSFIVQGGAGSGDMTFRVEEYGDYGKATIDQNGILTPTEVGKVLVYVEKKGDDQYTESRSDPVLVHILPAPITVQAKNKTAYVGSETPALTAADCTVTGLVGEDKLAKAPTISYVTTPDMTKPGAVAIQVTGAEIPNSNYDPNITYVPGVLTIQEEPAYTITVQPVENGTITADLETAKEGETITLTVKPAEEYRLETLTVTTDASSPGTVAVKDMGEGIYTFTMPAGEVVVSGTMVPEEATPEWPPFPFTDVSESDWYYDSVYYVYAYGLMNGTDSTMFSPNGSTTRGMLVTILYRMEGSPQGSGWGPFTDVNPGQYYAQPIAWAAWNGIVNGLSETTFGPDTPVTRQQMAAILYRYAAWKKWDVSQQGNLFQFTDWAQVQGYARTPLAWASAAGLIQGKENNLLDPAGTATRAQVATILQRFHSAYVAPAEEEAPLS